MKSKIAASLLLAAATLSVHAVNIATWTFETLPAFSTAAPGPYAADAGSGSATSSGVLTLNSPAGNGSLHSWSGNNWATGDYWQFSVSTVGFEDIILSWDQTSSATGPRDFTLAYRINGGAVINHLDYIVLPNQAGAPGLGAWTSGSAIAGYGFLVNLSAVLAVDNATTVDFRLIMRTTADATPPGDVGTTGTDRVDNFKVDASEIPTKPVPETLPFGFAAATLLLVLGLGCRRSQEFAKAKV